MNILLRFLFAVLLLTGTLSVYAEEEIEGAEDEVCSAELRKVTTRWQPFLVEDKPFEEFFEMVPAECVSCVLSRNRGENIFVRFGSHITKVTFRNRDLREEGNPLFEIGFLDLNIITLQLRHVLDIDTKVFEEGRSISEQYCFANTEGLPQIIQTMLEAYMDNVK